jgi:hypothetical protein
MSDNTEQQPAAEEKPTLLKRTSNLFGLLGGAQKPADAAEPKEEAIAEEPEAGPAEQAAGATPVAEEAPAEAEPAAEAEQAAVAEAPAELAEAVPTVEAVAEEAPVEESAPVEEPPVAEEAVAGVAPEAEEAVAEMAPEAAAPAEEGVHESQPEGAEAATGPAQEASGAAAATEGETAAAEQVAMGEVLDEEPKVTFEEQPKEEVSVPAETEKPAKKKSFFGGLFSRGKKEEEPAQAAEASEQPQASEEAPAGGAAACGACGHDPCACQPDGTPTSEGHAGEVAAGAGAAAVAGAAVGAGAVAATTSGDGEGTSGEHGQPAGGEQPVHEGILFKPGSICKKRIKQRHFRLMSDGSLQYSRKPTFKRSKTVQLLSGASVETSELEGDKVKHPFQLIVKQGKNEEYNLKCDSQDERDAWANDIRSVAGNIEPSSSPAA